MWFPGVKSLSSLVSSKMFWVSQMRVMLFSSQGLVWINFRGGFWGVWHCIYSTLHMSVSRIGNILISFINLSEQVHSVLSDQYFLYCSSVYILQRRVNETASLFKCTTAALLVAKDANCVWTMQALFATCVLIYFLSPYTVEGISVVKMLKFSLCKYSTVSYFCWKEKID